MYPSPCWHRTLSPPLATAPLSLRLLTGSALALSLTKALAHLGSFKITDSVHVPVIALTVPCPHWQRQCRPMGAVSSRLPVTGSGRSATKKTPI